MVASLSAQLLLLNIPVMLPRMTATGLTGLLSKLAGPVDTLTGSPAAQSISVEQAEDEPAERSDTAIPVESGSEVDEQRQITRVVLPSIALTQSELALLGALDLFVETPREAKRLFNLYRMVRTTRSLSPVSRFLGLDGRPGEFEAVAILLALSTSRARVCGTLLDTPPDERASGGLAHRPWSTDRGRFVADIEPYRETTGWANLFLPQTLSTFPSPSSEP